MEEIVHVVSSLGNPDKDNIIAAANDKCFDAAILAAFISRQTRGGSELDGTDGWIPCHNDAYQKCFGIMHMSQSKLSNPGYKIQNSAWIWRH